MVKIWSVKSVIVSLNFQINIKTTHAFTKHLLTFQSMANHAGWDAGNVYFSNQQLATDPDADAGGADPDMADQLPVTELQKRFREFVRTFRSGNNYIYRDQLLRHFRKGIHNLEVDLAHINHFDARMHDSIQKYPNQALPVLEDAAREALAGLTLNQQDEVPEMQVLLRSEQRSTSMRNLNASDVNRLILIPGIITSATRSKPRAQILCLKCRACGDVRYIKSLGPFSGFTVPRSCQTSGASAQGDGANDILGGAADCGQDPYLIIPEKCTYIDQQTLKLQEAPESVPTGEMPRNVLLSAERFLVDNASPGTRVAVMGVYSIFNSKGMGKSVGASNVRQPYIRIVGLRVLQDGSGRSNATFTPEEEERFAALARDPNIYDRMWSSVCPSISGDYTIDIKKAVTCLLFGGSRRVLPDG